MGQDRIQAERPTDVVQSQQNWNTLLWLHFAPWMENPATLRRNKAVLHKEKKSENTFFVAERLFTIKTWSSAVSWVHSLALEVQQQSPARTSTHQEPSLEARCRARNISRLRAWQPHTSSPLPSGPRALGGLGTRRWRHMGDESGPWAQDSPSAWLCPAAAGRKPPGGCTAAQALGSSRVLCSWNLSCPSCYISHPPVAVVTQSRSAQQRWAPRWVLMNHPRDTWPWLISSFCGKTTELIFLLVPDFKGCLCQALWIIGNNALFSSLRHVSVQSHKSHKGKKMLHFRDSFFLQS